jgi:Luciferase
MKTAMEIGEAIEHELLCWPGVTAGRHRFGGRAFHVGKIEIGHLHRSHVADLPFPQAIRDELVSSGKVSRHHHLPDSGWVSFYIRDKTDIPAVLALFRRNYERIQPAVQRQRASGEKVA